MYALKSRRRQPPLVKYMLDGATENSETSPRRIVSELWGGASADVTVLSSPAALDSAFGFLDQILNRPKLPCAAVSHFPRHRRE